MRKTRHEPLSPEAVALVAARFRVLSEPIRIRLLQALRGGEQNVTDLVETVESTQPNVSKHLRMLQQAGLVARRQERNSAFYSITDPSVFGLCDIVCRSVGQRLTADARLVEELRQRGSRPPRA